jgi:hypothetical protein
MRRAAYELWAADSQEHIVVKIHVHQTKFIYLWIAITQMLDVVDHQFQIRTRPGPASLLAVFRGSFLTRNGLDGVIAID